MDHLLSISGFGAPPRSAREAAEAILAQLDREAGRQNLNSPFAPFLAEGHRPDLMASAGRAFGEDNFAAPRAPAPSREDPGAFDIPYPAARNDDERIANVLWMLGNDGGNAPQAGLDDTTAPAFGIGNLFGLIGAAEAADPGGKKKPPGKFDFRRAGIANAILKQIRSNAMRQLYRRQRAMLSNLEPHNPLLETDPTLNDATAEQDIAAIQRELDAAKLRAAQRPSPLRLRPGGENENTIGGRAAHEIYKESAGAEGGIGNVPIGQGQADRMIFNATKRRALVKELKTNRPASIRRGEHQAEGYAKEYETKHKIPTDWSVDAYDLNEFLRWLLGQEK